MNPSYCRIRLPQAEAVSRFEAVLQRVPVTPPLPAGISEAVDLACDESGSWRGDAFLVSEASGWTLFQDLSGSLGELSQADWLRFAGDCELVFAGYNDAIPYGELLVVRHHVVIKRLLDEPGVPDAYVCFGSAESEFEDMTNWNDVAGFVDDDELGFSDAGCLLVYRKEPRCA